MKAALKFFWLVILLALIIHGGDVIRREWKRKFVYDHGEIVEVKITELNCPKGTMAFQFGRTFFEKGIDARTCVILNSGQTIKLKHSQQYADTFLFLNERNPNLFILGGLEMVLGIFALLANWPLVKTKQYVRKAFPRFSEN